MALWTPQSLLLAQYYLSHKAVVSASDLGRVQYHRIYVTSDIL